MAKIEDFIVYYKLKIDIIEFQRVNCRYLFGLLLSGSCICSRESAERVKR